MSSSAIGSNQVEGGRRRRRYDDDEEERRPPKGDNLLVKFLKFIFTKVLGWAIVLGLLLLAAYFVISKITGFVGGIFDFYKSLFTFKNSNFGLGIYESADCPKGYTNTGTTCAAKPFGRGVGFPWKIGDTPFREAGMKERCEAKHGKGNCENHNFIYYPKCQYLAKQKGYDYADQWTNDACCMCSPKFEYNHFSIADKGVCPPANDTKKVYTNKNGALCYIDCEKAYGKGYYNNGSACALKT